MVLVLTLWTLAILSLLLLTVTYAVSLNAGQASAAKQEATAEAIARGAVYATIQELVKGRARLERELKGAHAKPAGEGGPLDKFIQGSELGFYLVEPESWKAEKQEDPSAMPSEGDWLERSYAVCLVTAEDAKAPMLKLKAGNFARLPGASKEAAAAIEKLLKERQGKISCVEELLTLKSVQGLLYDGPPGRGAMPEILTPFSEGKLYVNGASAPAIAATFDIDMEKAAAVAEATKARRCFFSLEALEKATGVSAATLAESATLTPCVYRIKAYAVVRGRASKLEAVAALAPENSFKLAYMGAY